MLVSVALIIVIFVGGSRRMKMIPSGTQNVLEMTYEFVDVFLVRPFSLAVRLLANMMAGHILLTALALLTSYSLQNAPIVSIGPFLLNIGVTGFEILVAFLQAYIFTLLTAVYIGDSLH